MIVKKISTLLLLCVSVLAPLGMNTAAAAEEPAASLENAGCAVEVLHAETNETQVFYLDCDAVDAFVDEVSSLVDMQVINVANTTEEMVPRMCFVGFYYFHGALMPMYVPCPPPYLGPIWQLLQGDIIRPGI